MTIVLVHANLAKARFDLDDPRLDTFYEQVDAVNAEGYQSEGFIEEPELPDKREIFKPPFLLNVTVWQSVENLKDFAYAGHHLQLFRQRSNWFVEHEYPRYVLYWADAKHKPTERIVRERLIQLRDNGPSVLAFNFTAPFPKPAIIPALNTT